MKNGQFFFQMDQKKRNERGYDVFQEIVSKWSVFREQWVVTSLLWSKITKYWFLLCCDQNVESDRVKKLHWVTKQKLKTRLPYSIVHTYVINEYWPFWTQKVPNEASFNELKILLNFFFKILTAGRQIFVHYIRME